MQLKFISAPAPYQLVIKKNSAKFLFKSSHIRIQLFTYLVRTGESLSTPIPPHSSKKL